MKTSFLFDNAKRCTLDLLSFKCSDNDFMKSASEIMSRGCSHLWFELAAQYDFRPVSFYKNGLISGAIDENRLRLMQRRCSSARGAGIKLVLWLFTDDSPDIHKQSLETKKAYIKKALQYFDGYASEFVLALEANEYSDKGTMSTLAQYFKTLCAKPLGLHMTPGKYDWARDIKFIDKLYFQYGWISGNTSKITSMTKDAIAKVKKPVIAAEWSKNPDRKGAEAALKAGAAGVGNW